MLPAVAVGLLGAIAPLCSFACARSFAQHKVGSTFVVETSYDGHAMPGIEIEISREMDKEPYHVHLMSVTSNETGQGVVRGITPGRYFVGVEHAGVGGDAVELTVVGDGEVDGSVENSLQLNWPNMKVFKVRRIAGTLFRTPFDPTKQSVEPPLAGSKLTLRSARTGTQEGESAVRNDGSFAFPDLTPGLYIVHIKQEHLTEQSDQEEIDGDIFVQVLRDAKDDELPLLRLYMSDCGIGMRGKDGAEIF
jgi:hypothetical protein